MLEEVLDEAGAAADHALADPDPWHGFTEFATVYARLRAESCGVNDALGGAGSCDLGDTITDLGDSLRRLVDRAQQAGAMRDDITWCDVAFALAGVATQPRTIGLQAAPNQWTRNLRIVLDGLESRR
ncbi:SbtR family transcriptional regulator [Nocardia australiensis]|uniref:SbtR family transcriptional regulator n=1 Tax=Nocardia australiensis TaxID=2887191 RepID=UPI001D137511|nr:hypothetical protein [Nocardia australiensis]